MVKPNEHHDTITAGLRIVAERPNGEEHRGTLGAIARRNSDLAHSTR